MANFVSGSLPLDSYALTPLANAAACGCEVDGVEDGRLAATSLCAAAIMCESLHEYQQSLAMNEESGFIGQI